MPILNTKFHQITINERPKRASKIKANEVYKMNEPRVNQENKRVNLINSLSLLLTLPIPLTMFKHTMAKTNGPMTKDI